ncbi:MAG: peptidoglycan-binding domain-containing protein [Proteobacteria bacterium]|nr:peptidoglycan-binding domain-containing protein [Pseudomonadota bacterium]
MASMRVSVLAGVAVVALLMTANPVDAATRSQQPLGFESEQRDQNNLVLRIQKLLSAQGHFHGGADGRISDALRAAIRRYQRLTGRTVDGKVSEPLVQHLETQNRVGDMLNRLEKTRTESKKAARKALLEGVGTRAFINKGRGDDVADPTRDASPCFQDPTESCLLEEAVESAKAVAKSELRDWAFGEILVAQAKAGLIEKAISTVRRIGDARLIIVALRDIARAQAQSGRVGGAQEAAAIIPDRFKRLEALAAIADLQLRHKDLLGAVKTSAAVINEAKTLKAPLHDGGGNR